MLNKIKNGLNIFILFMFVVALVYGIIIIVYKTLNSENISNENIISKENVDIYIENKNLLKSDYNTFYSLEKCVQDIISSLNEGKNQEVYDILIKDMKTRVENKEKLTEYYNNNFKYEKLGDMGSKGYNNQNNLKEVYKADKDVYICIVKNTSEEGTTKIGIKKVNNVNYLISYLDI